MSSRQTLTDGCFIFCLHWTCLTLRQHSVYELLVRGVHQIVRYHVTTEHERRDSPIRLRQIRLRLLQISIIVVTFPRRLEDFVLSFQEDVWCIHWAGIAYTLPQVVGPECDTDETDLTESLANWKDWASKLQGEQKSSVTK